MATDRDVGHAQNTSGAEVVIAGKMADTKAGQELYTAYCVACHQPDGRGQNGAVAPDFVKHKELLAEGDAALLKSIADGVPGTSMIPFRDMLTDQQRRDTLAYMRQGFGKR